jgi:hypothetical protein
MGTIYLDFTDIQRHFLLKNEKRRIKKKFERDLIIDH